MPHETGRLEARAADQDARAEGEQAGAAVRLAGQQAADLEVLPADAQPVADGDAEADRQCRIDQGAVNAVAGRQQPGEPVAAHRLAVDRCAAVERPQSVDALQFHQRPAGAAPGRRRSRCRPCPQPYRPSPAGLPLPRPWRCAGARPAPRRSPRGGSAAPRRRRRESSARRRAGPRAPPCRASRCRRSRRRPAQGRRERYGSRARRRAVPGAPAGRRCRDRRRGRSFGGFGGRQSRIGPPIGSPIDPGIGDPAVGHAHDPACSARPARFRG